MHFQKRIKLLWRRDAAQHTAKAAAAQGGEQHPPKSLSSSIW